MKESINSKHTIPLESKVKKLLIKDLLLRLGCLEYWNVSHFGLIKDSKWLGGTWHKMGTSMSMARVRFGRVSARYGMHMG